MNRKLILGCLAVFFSASLASADIITNRPQQNHHYQNNTPPTYYSWDQGSPTLITASKSCGTTNLCIGQYTQTGGGWEYANHGFAWCNSIGSLGCPPIEDCLADNALNAKSSAPTIKTVYTPQGTSYYAQPAR